MKKKVLSVLLAAACVLSMAACGSKKDDSSDEPVTAKVIDIDLTDEEYAFGVDKTQPELLEKVKEKGVNIAHVTLHVGLGTFRPVKVDDVEKHHMHSEFYIVEEDQAKLINDTKKAGGRVISVGTTSCRTLESATGEDGILKAGSGWTEIFIYPGYHFKMIDGLITNFHLPESTLLMLVSALAGKETIMHAYEVAVQEKYRFFSFGDACILI